MEIELLIILLSLHLLWEIKVYNTDTCSYYSILSTILLWFNLWRAKIKTLIIYATKYVDNIFYTQTHTYLYIWQSAKKA